MCEWRDARSFIACFQRLRNLLRIVYCVSPECVTCLEWSSSFGIGGGVVPAIIIINVVIVITIIIIVILGTRAICSRNQPAIHKDPGFPSKSEHPSEALYFSPKDQDTYMALRVVVVYPPVHCE